MPQTSVTDTTKVSATVLGSQFAPAVTALSGGGYVIVWHDFDAGAIYAQRYNASGQPVGTELHLDSVQGGSPLWISVAPTPGDGFVISYQAGSFASAEIFAHRYDSAGNPSGAIFAVNTTTPNEQYNPHITALDNGTILFTWDTQASDVFQEVRGRIYTSDGQALGNDFPIAPMSATVENGLSAIAPLPGGGFVVTWQSATPMGSDNFEIVGQRFNSSGAAVGAQFQANTATANSQFGNDVARLSDGSFVVTWVDAPSNNGGGRIVARHYDASGVAIGGEILIDSKASGGYGRTVVTALANGAYVVGWMEADSANNNVLARAMGSNDVPMGVAFEMTFDSPFGANFFSDGAVTLANGNVVFTWDGPSVTPPGGQGTGEDVYMRVYNFSGSTPGQGGAGPDVLTGTAGDDTLDGMGGDDSLNGLGGNDTLIGGPGSDTMIGGMGNDFYYVDNVGDTVSEAAGEGNDRVFASVSYTLTAGASVEVFTTSSNTGTTAINLTGNELANVIYGNDGNNVLDGKAGADTLGGRSGDDWFFVDNAGDAIVELAGEGNDRVFASVSYTLTAGASVEMLTTSSNTGTTAINLTGNELAQAIYGNDGANTLDGKGGNDFLCGRTGADTFAFTTAPGAGNVDTIFDFQTGVDKIALDDALFTGIGTPGAFNAGAFVAGTAAADGNDRIIYNNATGQLFYDADGIGPGGAVLFATLTGAPVLNASDFMVI